MGAGSRVAHAAVEFELADAAVGDRELRAQTRDQLALTLVVIQRGAQASAQ